MTLLFTESFDNITAWTLAGTAGNWTTVAGRTGNCIQVASSGDNIWRAFGTDGATATLGFAFNVSALWDDRVLASLWGDGFSAAQHISLVSMANGSLKVMRGNAFGTLLGVSATGLIVANTWYFVELQAVLSDTVGTIEVRRNGTAVIGPTTGLDTKNGGTKTVFDTVSLTSFVGGTTTKFDDLYLRNDATFGAVEPVDERKWWPEGYKYPAFQVRRQVYSTATGGDYVRGSGDLGLAHTALRYPTLPKGFSSIDNKAILHLRPFDYHTVEVEWGWPTNLDDWLEVSLVRSAFGRPSTVNDGQTIYRRPQSAFVQPDDTLALPPIVLDENLPGGRWYYYGLFFKISPKQWARGIAGGTLIPRDFGFKEKLWEGLPPYYRWVDDEYRNNSGFLRQFMSIIAFELDTTREFIESWQNLYNADWSPMRLLRHLGSNFGVDYEAGVGDIRYRSLMANIGATYEARGTEKSLEWVIESMSKYQCDLTSGIGLSLVPDDSDFFLGTGSWGVIHPATKPTSWVTGLSPAKVRLEKAPSSEVLPESGRGVMRIRTLPADATGDITIACGDDVWCADPADTGTEYLPLNRGIPTNPGVSYTFAADVKATKTPLIVELSLVFFNKGGQPSDLEDSITATAESLSDTAWHTLKIELQTPLESGFVVPVIKFTNRLSDVGPWSPPIYVAAVMIYKTGEAGEDAVPPPDHFLTLGDASETIGAIKPGDPSFVPFVLGTPRSAT